MVVENDVPPAAMGLSFIERDDPAIARKAKVMRMFGQVMFFLARLRRFLPAT